VSPSRSSSTRAERPDHGFRRNDAG
jgi:hypothetical protein